MIGGQMDAPVTVAFRAPRPELAPYISSYYELTVQGDTQVEDYLHPEWGNIRIALGNPWIIGSDANGAGRYSGDPSILHGCTSKPTYLRGCGRSFGIGILPLGWNRLFKVDASSLADRIVPLASVLQDKQGASFIEDMHGARDLDARKAVADQFLWDRISASRPDRSSRLIPGLLALLADPDNATVEHLTVPLGINQVQLARLSKRTLGFTPKLLLRRQRFLRMLGIMYGRPYAEWRDFIDPQYSDQSHLVRDFQYFVGMSPRAYFNMPRPILTAAAAARAAMFGQPLQGLHGAPDAKTWISSKTS
ncbi:hypothetical protein [Blastomonas sp. AAP53]|uniref:DUF6597 domain-containing transcriptional factor n=1 Tax=Blastomonas sp. AAP53 TaxID=1248760 RepID=UPI00031F0E94|nr:hypothetical protein [Blastomonas sp. AAP53]